MGKEYIEPYLKENNLLQLSLFYFGKGRPNRTLVDWADSEGKCRLECICKYGVPGSFDQDVYTASMRIWVKQGMPQEGIFLNYSDIARELHLKPPKDWVGKIKESLKKLAQARYEFTQCFIKADKDGNKKIDTHFSLFDSASLFEYRKGTSKSKRNSESQLIFPDKVQQNLEAKYYQYLEMVWYRALPDGLPRRLYEYLEKRRYHNIKGVFTISEEAICRWLPIIDKNCTNRRKRLATIAQALIDKGYLAGYGFDQRRKLCSFTYAQPSKAHVEQLIDKPAPALPAPDSATPLPQQPQHQQVGIEEQSAYYEAIRWLDSIPFFHKKRKDEIAALPLTQVAKLYSSIRQKYEEMTKTGKRPGPGWVYDAFKSQYIFKQDIKKAEAEEKEKIANEKIARIEDIKNFIEEKGRVNNLLYFNQKICQVVDIGLYLETGVVLWQEVKLEGFTVITPEE